MISCTEFIPSYSELFAYLEDKHGPEEVRRFWKYLFEPDGTGIPLIKFLEEDGIAGCFNYWAITLNEEAADFTMYLNEEAGWFLNVMHSCPSKGFLLRLQDEIGLKPYPNYCFHCDSYRMAAQKVGFQYIYNFIGIDHAECSMLIYDPKRFDGRIIVDEHTKVMNRSAAQNEYFHKDFHSSLNMGIDYLGKNYGVDAIEEFYRAYARHVYGSVIEKAREEGLRVIGEMILDTYCKEKAPDAVSTELCDGVLKVKVAYCPGVKHLHDTGRKVSQWYRYSTKSVMETIAEDAGYHFELLFYDEDTGAAEYRFFQ